MNTPNESLTPHLQDLKRRYTELLNSFPTSAFNPATPEERINALLRGSGEPGIKAPKLKAITDSSCSPPVKRITNIPQAQAAQEIFQARLKDLERRKPHLHTAVRRIMHEYNQHLGAAHLLL